MERALKERIIGAIVLVAVVVLVGDFDRDTGLSLIQKHFGSIPRVKDAPETPPS